jgi:hypothetical protein
MHSSHMVSFCPDNLAYFLMIPINLHDYSNLIAKPRRRNYLWHARQKFRGIGYEMADGDSKHSKVR